MGEEILCGECCEFGLSSIWQLRRGHLTYCLCTRCANRLRGGGYDVDVATLTIRDKEASDVKS